jgi:hypothetical protein
MRNQRRHILPRLVVAGLALIAVLLLSAPSAFASEGCPNEQIRAESKVDPATGQPYSLGLPECRAYEMVTPLEKQQHDAISTFNPTQVFASALGSAIEFVSQGDYAQAESYEARTIAPQNPYVARRASAGWVTTFAAPPPTVLEEPAGTYALSLSPDFRDEVVCGTSMLTRGTGSGPSVRCATRETPAGWLTTPDFEVLDGGNFAETLVQGASRTGEDVVFYGEAGIPFLPSDTSSHCGEVGGHCGGIYEIVGIRTPAPELQLVNVDDGGTMIGAETVNALGGIVTGADQEDTNRAAISADGAKVFFTATPSGGVATVYARVDGTETVPLSAPSPRCSVCGATPAPAVYQGASADGSKVFFTTNQPLLESDTDATNDLYMYDFDRPPGQNLVQISRGGAGDASPGAGAEVEGRPLAVSEDGSLVYFIATGVLTTLPNMRGQLATRGGNNLYAYNTETEETKFVATLEGADDQLWGVAAQGNAGAENIQLAQTTPSGRYLVFDSFARLVTAGVEADSSGAQQVYRYDFRTGALVRVSVGHEGFAADGNTPGFDAVIGPADSGELGAFPTAADSSRAINEDGNEIAFVSAAALESSDHAVGTNTSCGGIKVLDAGAGCEIYLWRECADAACADGNAGEVDLLSDGQDPAGAVYAGMSGTGEDVFFQTRAQLVAQDTDPLGDIYDARVDGGFPAPAPEPSCSGEACQGTESSSPTFGALGSQSFTGGGNQTPPPFKEVLEPETKPKSKPLTRAQKLAKAAKLCKRDKSAKRRKACEAAAKMKYRARKRGKK